MCKNVYIKKTNETNAAIFLTLIFFNRTWGWNGDSCNRNRSKVQIQSEAAEAEALEEPVKPAIPREKKQQKCLLFVVCVLLEGPALLQRWKITVYLHAGGESRDLHRMENAKTPRPLADLPRSSSAETGDADGEIGEVDRAIVELFKTLRYQNQNDLSYPVQCGTSDC